MAGGVPVRDLIVAPPLEGEERWIEIQIGYEVVAPGRSTRRGIELLYEYEGARHRVLIPSNLAICAPRTVVCEPEYDSIITLVIDAEGGVRAIRSKFGAATPVDASCASMR